MLFYESVKYYKQMNGNDLEISSATDHQLWQAQTTTY